jgi:uncharacterized protein YdaU (DUF1376 family)
MHYYPHNIADYRKDTSHLSLLEHGCYHQLLDQYYLNEQPLPLDESKLFRLINARTEDEKIAIRMVLDDFFDKTEDGFIHTRCDIEIEKFHLIGEKASKSAQRRWGNAKAMPTQCQGNAKAMLTKNQEPITKNQELITSNNKCIDHFNEFWLAYPKKVGKESARKAWDKIRPNIEVVLNALAWQKESDQWFKNGGQFVPNPATYLNQHRFMDERPSRLTF